MKVPLFWLKDYVDVSVPVEDLAERLTLAGLEVENIDYIGLAPQRKAKVHGAFDSERAAQAGLAWERDKIVTAAVLVVKPGYKGDDAFTEQLKEFLKQHIAIYKLPRIFQYMDALPRTPTGKLLRRLLR